MTSTNRPLPVKVRLMGHPDDVATLADRIEFDPATTVIDRSTAYTNRGNSDQVRVYLELIQHP